MICGIKTDWISTVLNCWAWKTYQGSPFIALCNTVLEIHWIQRLNNSCILLILLTFNMIVKLYFISLRLRCVHDRYRQKWLCMFKKILVQGFFILFEKYENIYETTKHVLFCFLR